MSNELPRAYTILFNAITDALAALERHDYDQAEALLILAQQEAEDAYINAEA